MRMLVIVIAIVAAQNLLPGIGKNVFKGGRCRIHHHLQQRLVGMGRYGRLIRPGHLGGTLSGHIGRHRSCALSGLTADGQNIGNLGSCLGGYHLVHKGCAGTQAHHLQVTGASELVEQLLKNLEIGLCIILVPCGIDDDGRSVVGVQQGLDVHIGQ